MERYNTLDQFSLSTFLLPQSYTEASSGTQLQGEKSEWIRWHIVTVTVIAQGEIATKKCLFIFNIFEGARSHVESSSLSRSWVLEAGEVCVCVCVFLNPSLPQQQHNPGDYIATIAPHIPLQNLRKTGLISSQRNSIHVLSEDMPITF